MQLTEHFTLEELTASDFALRHGIDNTPVGDVIMHLQFLAERLEVIRTLVGVPIHVNSAYRCDRVNTGIGSTSTSAHCQGLAADIVVPGYSTLALAHLIRANAKTSISINYCSRDIGVTSDLRHLRA